jgi:hypothetical protein
MIRSRTKVCGAACPSAGYASVAGKISDANRSIRFIIVRERCDNYLVYLAMPSMEYDHLVIRLEDGINASCHANTQRGQVDLGLRLGWSNDTQITSASNQRRST